MVQRKSYPRTYLERHGQRNPRVSDSGMLRSIQLVDNEDNPNCCILVTKRKGFGVTDNKESDTMSLKGVAFLMKSFPPERFDRYLIKVYLKEKSYGL